MKTKKAKDIKKGCLIWVGPKSKTLGKVTAVGEPYPGGKRFEWKQEGGKGKGVLVVDDSADVPFKPTHKEKKFSGQYFWLGYVLGILTWQVLLAVQQFYPQGVFHY